MIGYEVFMASCPHCGAPVTDKVCPYCGSLIGSLSEENNQSQRSRAGQSASYESRIASFATYDPVLKGINRCADDILSAYSKHSNAVYEFMDRNKIGHSEYYERRHLLRQRLWKSSHFARNLSLSSCSCVGFIERYIVCTNLKHKTM